MLSGNDDIIVPMMSIGAKGVISVLTNCAPLQTAKICDLCLNNKYSEATELANKLLDFTNGLFMEVNPIPVKEALNYMGFNVGGYRAPLDYMSEKNRATLFAEIDKNKEIIF
jgi:4-hydroxy-tetrahydrodipicolinate synthase